MSINIMYIPKNLQDIPDTHITNLGILFTYFEVHVLRKEEMREKGIRVFFCSLAEHTALVLFYSLKKLVALCTYDIP